MAQRSTDQLAKYVKGAAEPPFLPLSRLCLSAGVRLEWLATGASPMLASEEPRRAEAAAPMELSEHRLAEALALLEHFADVADVDLVPSRMASVLVAIYRCLEEQGDSLAASNVVDLHRYVIAKLRGEQ